MLPFFCCLYCKPINSNQKSLIMKKLAITLLVAISATTFSKAQTQKGTWLLGGGFALSSSSTPGGSSLTVFQLNPNIGYFVSDDWAIGAELALVSSDGSSVYAFGPYARGYFGKSTSGKVFVQAGIGFGGSSDGGSSTSFLGSFGYAFFLNKNIAFEVAASIGAGNGVTTIGTGVGLQIHFKSGEKK